MDIIKVRDSKLRKSFRTFHAASRLQVLRLKGAFASVNDTGAVEPLRTSEFSTSSSQEGTRLSGSLSVDWSKRTERSRRKRKPGKAPTTGKTMDRKHLVAWKAYAREVRCKMKFWERISIVREIFRCVAVAPTLEQASAAYEQTKTPP